MDKNNRLVIEIYEESVFATRIMDIDKENDFFYTAFQQAGKVLADIVRKTKEHNSKNKSQKYCKLKQNKIYFYSNNIISFCAGRGHGKTSAMRSFAQGMKHFNGAENDKNSFCELQITNHKARFHILPHIDPTMLENKDSILKTIFSRMFHEVEEKYECTGDESTQNEEIYTDLAVLFGKCFESIDVIKDQKNVDTSDYMENLEQLSHLGDSTHLSSQFHALVQLFLKYMFHFFEEDDHFLVIQVDDADMNVENAYEITEDIRRYCMIPNVIVIMATDVRQLEQTVEQHFLEAFKQSVSLHEKEYGSICLTLAQNYIDKLLPATHQIRLPNIDTSMQDPLIDLRLKYVRKDATEKTETGPESKEDSDYDYQLYLIDKLKVKFGIYLVKKEQTLHYLLPNTLRTLSHFLEFLKDIPDISVEGKSFPLGTGEQTLYYLMFNHKENLQEKLNTLAKWQQNLSKLMDYFLGEWASIHLTWKERNLLEGLNGTPIHLKKSCLVEELFRYFSLSTKTSLQKPHPQYCTLADVRFLLEKAKNLASEEGSTYSFLYAIHFYLTLYCTSLMVHDLSKTVENKDNAGNVSKHDEEYLIPFLNGAECPWGLLEIGNQPDLQFGGFEIDLQELLKIAHDAAGVDQDVVPDVTQTANLSLLSSCLRSEREILGSQKDVKERIFFDPLNLSNIFPEKTLSKILPTFISSDHKSIDPEDVNFLFCLLAVNINWDLTNQFLEDLRLYQEKQYSTTKSFREVLLGKAPLTDSATRWVNLMSHQRGFYKCLSEIYVNAQKSVLNNDNEGENSKKVLVEKYFKAVINVSLWDKVYLSNDSYLQKVKDIFPDQLKIFLEKIDEGMFMDIQIALEQENPKTVREQVRPSISILKKNKVIYNRPFLDEMFGTTETLSSALDIQDLHYDYGKIFNIYLEIIKTLTNLLKDNVTIENVQATKEAFECKYNDFLELYAKLIKSAENISFDSEKTK